MPTWRRTTNLDNVEPFGEGLGSAAVVRRFKKHIGVVVIVFLFVVCELFKGRVFKARAGAAVEHLIRRAY